MESLIHLDNLSYTFPNGKTLFTNLNLSLDSGSTCVISGPIGCGKSTLLRCMVGLIPHLNGGTLTGNIYIDKQNTKSTPLWKLVTCFGTVLQNPDLQSIASTIYEELCFSIQLLPLSSKEKECRLTQAIEQFNLSSILDRNFANCSGGEQQKVMLACSQLHEPAIILCDEPFEMLDFSSKKEVQQIFSSFHKKNKTLIIFEHDDHGIQNIENIVHFTFPKLTIKKPRCSLENLYSHIPDAKDFALSLNNVSVVKNGNTILKGIQFSIQNSECVLVTGRNGSGKTTLLKSIASIENYSGAITFLDSNSSNIKRPSASLVFQNPELQFFNDSILKELIYNCQHEHGDEIARALLDIFGILHLQDKPPLLLSVGQKKLVSIIIALMLKPTSIFLLDEPTLGLDSFYKDIIASVIKILVQKGFACIVVSHESNWLQPLIRRRITLENGLLIEDEHIANE